MAMQFQAKAGGRRTAARAGWRRAAGPLALALVGLGLDPRAGWTAEVLTKPAAAAPQFDARVRLDYEYRSQGSEKDSDLYGYWNAGGRDLGKGILDIYTSGRLHRDLDRPATPSLADDRFLSLDDLNGVTENRLLQLYGDLHDRENRLSLRAGRQYVEVSDYLHLDGAQALLFENGTLGGRAFVGRPVSFYSPTSDDTAWGLSLVGRPWTGNRSRLTYTEYDSPAGDDAEYRAEVQQEISSALRLRGQLSVLNEDFRMGSIDAFYFAPSGETDAYLGISRWGSFDARTRAYSPLLEVLGAQSPYTYGYARFSRVLFAHLAISPGVSVRWAEDDGAPYANRDYRDYNLTLNYEPCRAFSASVALDYWDMAGGDSFLGVSGDLRYRHGKRWEVSVGSAYTKYTYTTYSDISYSVNGGQTIFSEDGTVAEETPHAYSYFLRVKWNVNRHLVLRAQGDIEDDSTVSELAYRGRASVEVRL